MTWIQDLILNHRFWDSRVLGLILTMLLNEEHQLSIRASSKSLNATEQNHCQFTSKIIIYWINVNIKQKLNQQCSCYCIIFKAYHKINEERKKYLTELDEVSIMLMQNCNYLKYHSSTIVLQQVKNLGFDQLY